MSVAPRESIRLDNSNTRDLDTRNTKFKKARFKKIGVDFSNSVVANYNTLKSGSHFHVNFAGPKLSITHYNNKGDNLDKQFNTIQPMLDNVMGLNGNYAYVSKDTKTIINSHAGCESPFFSNRTNNVSSESLRMGAPTEFTITGANFCAKTDVLREVDIKQTSVQLGGTAKVLYQGNNTDTRNTYQIGVIGQYIDDKTVVRGELGFAGCKEFSEKWGKLNDPQSKGSQNGVYTALYARRDLSSKLSISGGVGTTHTKSNFKPEYVQEKHKNSWTTVNVEYHASRNVDVNLNIAKGFANSAQNRSFTIGAGVKVNLDSGPSLKYRTEKL